MTEPLPPEGDLPKESPRTILFQFVVFPLGIVMIGVAIFLLFGRLASEEHEIPDYLNDIRSGSAHERWQAAYQLSKSLKRGEAKKYPNLVQQVSSLYVQSKNDDPRIRRYLSMVLGSLGDRRATPLLLEALAERDVETRIYALLALGQIGDPSAAPALAAALGDPVADIRYNAAIALARMGDKRALGVLREMLDRSRLDRVEGMRPEQKEEALVAAIAAYSALAGAEARPELERLAAGDVSLRVKAAAKEALANGAR